MAEAVRSLPHELLNYVDLKIINVLKIEGLNRQKELNIFRIPSMTINNMLSFETFIPDEEELIDAINEFLLEDGEEPTHGA